MRRTSLSFPESGRMCVSVRWESCHLYFAAVARWRGQPSQKGPTRLETRPMARYGHYYTCCLLISHHFTSHPSVCRPANHLAPPSHIGLYTRNNAVQCVAIPFLTPHHVSLLCSNHAEQIPSGGSGKGSFPNHACQTHTPSLPASATAERGPPR